MFDKLREHGYERRESQERMGRDIEEFLGSKERILFAEAPTGTGKTFAYLIPCLLSGKKIVVSTYSKALQRQLLGDIEELKRIYGLERSVGVWKGVSSYVCREKLEEELSGGSGEAREVAERAEAREGDVEDIDLPSEVIRKYTVEDRDECGGCTRKDCWYLRAKKKALLSDITVLNHHAFMVEPNVWSHADVVIIDEAHEFPEVYCEALATEFSEKEIKRFLPWEGDIEEKNLGKVLEELKKVYEEKRKEAKKRVSEILPSRPSITEITLRGLKKYAGVDVEDAVIIEGYSRLDRRIWRELRGVKKLGKLIEAIENYLIPGRGYVSFRDKGKFRKISLFGNVPPAKKIVFVSATLDEEYMTMMLSLEEGDYLFRRYEKEWNWDLDIRLVDVNPKEERWKDVLKNCISRARDLHEKVIVLLTAREHLSFVDTPLKQGTFPVSVLVEKFKEEGGVLAGADTFWKGIDIPGRKGLVISKIPFTNPEDKLHALRCKFLEEYYGKEAKWRFIKAKARMNLKQGIGRLKRRKEDTGTVWFLDNRVLKPFFKEFLCILRNYGGVKVEAV